MQLELSDEQEAFRKVVRAFAEAEVAPHAEQWNREQTFPLDTVLAMGELGLFGLLFPEEYEGSDADLTTMCIAIEELAKVDQSIAITLEVAVVGILPLHLYGNDEQRAEWLADCVAGRRLPAFCLTEPDTGSDAGGLRTRAVLDEAASQWVINGEKAFITHSGTEITSVFIVTAVTGTTAAGRSEISTILVPAGTPGLVVGPAYRKMGWHGSDTHPVSFVDCRVPVHNLLGEQGRGLANMLNALDDGRVAIAALALGVIESCLTECRRYANERIAFGRPIGANQAVAFKIADMAVAAEAARLLVYRAAGLRDAGRPFKKEAAVAKLYASEAASDATRAATQIFGGAGFMAETLVARHYVDTRALEIGEGTSEIQRLVISRELGLPLS